MNSRITLFPITSEVNKAGHLVIGGCDTTELAARYGTPLYLFDEATLRKRCRDFKNEFGKRYADTTVLYASKAYLSGALANLLKEEGLGIDVVSGGELFIADSAGFPMDMVYFHGNNKSVEELKVALKRHIGRIVVDSLDELAMLTALAEESGHIPDILLRITPGIEAHTHSHIVTGGAGSKFGFPMYMAEEAISRALAAPSVNLVGLHFHIGSLITDVYPYLESIDLVLELAADMKRKYGFELEELNIGGGYGVAYTLDDQAPEISYYADNITSRITAKCQELKLTLPGLVIEPGRSIVAQAGVALYRAGNIKDVAGPLRYVAVDGGMADNIRPALYSSRYEAVLAGRMNEKDMAAVTIAGRFCESGDILVRDIKLPPVASGDIIAIPVCGAYCIPMASNYNASLKAPIVMLAGGRDRLIRRRETFQDLTHCDLL
ncbi:MAG: diaminopimelate decarboxylase [Dehalococcoidia bacterium]|nr:MAG: diaminopimelate decarboxylase [Dehalococcoidia bacterium]